MKSLKIIISLSLLMFYVSIINVDAKENLNEVYGGEYVLTDEEILENEQIALEFAKNQHRNHQTRMDEIVENWVKDGSGISNESPKGLVFNQAPGGYKYGAGGGGMYWGTSSSTTGSVSMGVSINSKTISFSVSYAPGSRYESSGHFKTCPASLWNKYVKLYSTTRYKVTKYKVYRKNKYSSGQGTFVRNEYVPTPYSYAFQLCSLHINE